MKMLNYVLTIFQAARKSINHTSSNVCFDWMEFSDTVEVESVSCSWESWPQWKNTVLTGGTESVVIRDVAVS